MFKEELNELVNDEIIPLLPKIGLLNGGVTVVEHIIKKRMGTEKTPDEMKEPTDIDLDS